MGPTKYLIGDRGMKRGSNVVLSLLFMAIYLLLGVFLIVNPDPSAKIICGMIAGILGFLGVVRVINYFRLDRYEAMLRKELANGAFFILIAFYVIMRTDAVFGVVHIFLGVLLVYEGMGLLQNAVDLFYAKSKMWPVNLVAGGATVALAAVALFNPFKKAQTLMTFIGITFVVAGVAVLVSMFLMRKFNKEFKKQEIVPAEKK